MRRQHYQRAVLLRRHDRNEEAIRELETELAADPESSESLSLMALCLSDLGRFDDATRRAQLAIALAPGDSRAHHALARVLRDRGRGTDALRAIREAVRIHPEAVEHHALEAALLARERRWSQAIEAAGRGLALVPDDVGCLNLRALALAELGRLAEAKADMGSALGRDPECSHSHANCGWVHLHEREVAPALEHFAEALRQDPGNEWARAGLVEALKARNVVYLRWVGDGLFNLMLLLDRKGRAVMNREERRSGALVGSACVLGLSLFAANAALGHAPTAWLTLLAAVLLAIPVSGAFAVQARGPRILASAIAALVAAGVVGAGVLGLTEAHEIGSTMAASCIAASLLDAWLVAALRRVRVRE